MKRDNLSHFKANTISTKTAQPVKGGFHYVTSCRISFAAKRNELQNQRVTLDIKHQYNGYCIEW